MKNIILIALLVPFFCKAQKISENKLDEFTHHAVKRTSWEILTYKWTTVWRSRFSRIDTAFFLDVKLLCDGSCVMRQGDKIMIKLENDQIISLESPELVAGCIGCGATGLTGSGKLGLSLAFPIDQENVNILSHNKIVKVRLYLADGYQEHEISKGNAAAFLKTAELINQ